MGENVWPEQLMIRDTQIFDDGGGRIYTTTGFGYEKRKYIRADLADPERLKLALEALEHANSVMSYVAGDAWERECTAEDRAAFESIYAQLFPPAPAPPAAPAPTRCPVCSKKCKGMTGVHDHMKAVHPGMPFSYTVSEP